MSRDVIAWICTSPLLVIGLVGIWLRVRYWVYLLIAMLLVGIYADYPATRPAINAIVRHINTIFRQHDQRQNRKWGIPD